MCAVVAVADGVIDEENAEEFVDQYREPEPEEPYREQELPEGFEYGKFNIILWLHISTQFYKHNLLAYFTKLHMFCLHENTDG